MRRKARKVCKGPTPSRSLASLQCLQKNCNDRHACTYYECHVACARLHLLAMFGLAPPLTRSSCTTLEWPSRDAYISDVWPHLSLTLVSASSAMQRSIERTSSEFNSDLKHSWINSCPSASFSSLDLDITTECHEFAVFNKLCQTIHNLDVAFCSALPSSDLLLNADCNFTPSSLCHFGFPVATAP